MAAADKPRAVGADFGRPRACDIIVATVTPVVTEA